MTGPAEMDGLLRRRGGELAEALARQAAGVLAGRTFTDEQIAEAADAALAAVVATLSGGSGEAPAPAGVLLNVLTVARELRRLPTETVARRDELAGYLDAVALTLQSGEAPAGLTEKQMEALMIGTEHVTHSRQQDRYRKELRSARAWLAAALRGPVGGGPGGDA